MISKIYLLFLTMFKFKPCPLKSFFIILSLCSLILIFSTLFIKANYLFLISFTVININRCPISIPLLLDRFSLLFGATVIFISSNIILFSLFYIKGDPLLLRFSYTVVLFIISINLLIFIPNILALLIGWDGLGIIRFILVIYYQNNKSLRAGILTALTNRIGDCLILISIAIIFSQSHWSISSVWVETIKNYKWIIMLLFIAFCTKRAQIPFSAWLPAAIAAPTPVSALVHSSTLVTAGVYLLFRFYPFLTIFKWFSIRLLIMGVRTIIISGLAALLENDIKKIIALSTLRQLGVITTSLALGLPNIAFFHLITHALFKALLFICAGVIINFHLHRQDLRSIGGIFSKLPLTCAAAVVANLSLCGAPFLAGFYSKDRIIERILFSNFNLTSAALFLLAVTITTIYSFRFLNILFTQPPILPPRALINDTTSAKLPLLLIGSLAVIRGAAVIWQILEPINILLLPPYIKYLTLIIIIFGIIIRKSLTLKYPTLIKTQWPLTHYFSLTIWGLTRFSRALPLSPSYKIAAVQLKFIDQGWLEVFGPRNLLLLNTSSSSNVRKYQNLSINFSIFCMLSVSFIIVYLYLNSLNKSLTLKMLL